MKEKPVNNFRFQNISKENTANKVLKGDMIAEITFPTELVYADTSKNSFFIYDRAQNKSNIAETPEFFLNE